MIYPFHVYRAYTGDDFFWVASSDVLLGCIGQGRTARAAIRELRGNERAWVKFAKAYKDDVRIPTVPVVSLDDDSVLQVNPKI